MNIFRSLRCCLGEQKGVQLCQKTQAEQKKHAWRKLVIFPARRVVFIVSAAELDQKGFCWIFYYYLIKEQKDFCCFVGLYSFGSDLVFSQPVPLWGSHRWLYLIYFTPLRSLWTNNTLPDHCSRCRTRKRCCQGNSCAVYSSAMYVYLSSRPGCLITTIKPCSLNYPSSLCARELPLFNFETNYT